MKYCVHNNLDLFEFHDSIFSFVSFDGADLVVSARYLNIHKDTEQNPSDYDMEIDRAEIAFRGFRQATYEPGRVWKMGEDGKSYPDGPRVVFSGGEALDRILAELRHEMWVYHVEKGEDGRYSIDGCGEEPYFTVEFTFDCVQISWDAYKKKAWYALHRQFRYDLTLGTPEGDTQVELYIGCQEESTPAVNVGCKYHDRQYWGHGNDYLWMDAFADLQRQLPKGVSLKCCLTCRHGSLCPVGNEENELFCTKDVAITQKSDLYFYTEDRGEREKRSRQYCNLCGDFRPQSEDFYTYNDYLDFLKKG